MTTTENPTAFLSAYTAAALRLFPGRRYLTAHQDAIVVRAAVEATR